MNLAFRLSLWFPIAFRLSCDFRFRRSYSVFPFRYRFVSVPLSFRFRFAIVSLSLSFRYCTVIVPLSFHFHSAFVLLLGYCVALYVWVIPSTTNFCDFAKPFVLVSTFMSLITDRFRRTTFLHKGVLFNCWCYRLSFDCVACRWLVPLSFTIVTVTVIPSRICCDLLGSIVLMSFVRLSRVPSAGVSIAYYRYRYRNSVSNLSRIYVSYRSISARYADYVLVRWGLAIEDM